MNKKFLSAVLFGALIVGSSVTFTGCIDNDEPAGIENLRGAKAELLRAKVAVEEANAAAKNAEAALTLAKAETEKAHAEQVKAQTELIRLQAEYEAAQNEAEKARLEAEITLTKQLMEENALRHQADMLKLQEGLAVAKREYEVALKQIEIAQALMSEEAKVTVAGLKRAVEDAQNEVDQKAEAVKTAEKNYYNAVLDSRVDSVNFKSLELEVTRAKAAQVVAEETLAKWNDFLKKDTETADWRKEVTVLEDSIEGLEKKQSELKVELAKRENSEEYKKLIDAKDQAIAAYNNLKTQEKLEYKDMMDNVNGKVDKNTPINNALVLIGGPKKDGKGGYIADYNIAIASYTSEKKALLDEYANMTEEKAKALKKDADDKVKAWKDALAKYNGIGSFNVDNYEEKTLKPIIKKQLDVINDQQAIVDATDVAITDAMKNAAKAAIISAEGTIAKALVDYAGQVKTYGYCDDAKIKLEYIIVENGKVSTKKDKELTVVEWLSDTSNAAYFLEQLAGVRAAKNLTMDNILSIQVIKNVVATANDIKTEKLIPASVNAFGTELLVNNEGYMRVEPTAAEMKAVGYENCGALGRYTATQDPSHEFEAKNYKKIIADYEKALKYWNDQLTALKKTQATAETAKNAAQAAFDAYREDNIEALEMEIEGEIGGRLRALREIKSALIGAIKDWLPEGNEGYSSTEEFETWLKGKVEKAEEAVIKAEKAVVKAENNLIKAKDGKYDKLTDAKEDLDEAMAELEKAQAELAEATANLQKGVEIMSKTADAE